MAWPTLSSRCRVKSQAGELGHAEWLALLFDREVANRNTRRFQVRLRAARLRHGQAAIEDVDHRTPQRLDKALFLATRGQQIDCRTSQSAGNRTVRAGDMMHISLCH